MCVCVCVSHIVRYETAPYLMDVNYTSIYKGMYVLPSVAYIIEVMWWDVIFDVCKPTREQDTECCNIKMAGARRLIKCKFMWHLYRSAQQSGLRSSIKRHIQSSPDSRSIWLHHTPRSDTMPSCQMHTCVTLNCSKQQLQYTHTCTKKNPFPIQQTREVGVGCAIIDALLPHLRLWVGIISRNTAQGSASSALPSARPSIVP